MEPKYEEPMAHKYLELQSVGSVPLPSEAAASRSTYLEPKKNPVPDGGGQRVVSGQPNVYEEIK